jgi:hypothetical protein
MSIRLAACSSLCTLFAFSAVLTLGCADSASENAKSRPTGETVNSGREEADVSALLKKGMTPAEVIDKIGVTHFSVGPVINLGTQNVRYRASTLPGKVLDAEFTVLTTGKSLADWKVTDEESYDEWLPVEAAQMEEEIPRKD